MLRQKLPRNSTPKVNGDLASTPLARVCGCMAQPRTVPLKRNRGHIQTQLSCVYAETQCIPTRNINARQEHM